MYLSPVCSAATVDWTTLDRHMKVNHQWSQRIDERDASEGNDNVVEWWYSEQECWAGTEGGYRQWGFNDEIVDS